MNFRRLNAFTSSVVRSNHSLVKSAMLTSFPRFICFKLRPIKVALAHGSSEFLP